MRAPLLALALTLATAASARAGETACWFENGAVVAPAAIGDMTGDFVIDLSAPRTLLHDTKAQAGGFEATDLSLPVRVAGEALPAQPVAVTDLDYRGVGFAAPIAGVIGADILARYTVIIDFAPCRLRLEPAGGRSRPSGPSLPVEMIGGVPTVLATASDGFTSVRGPFALDTASGGILRARGAADGPRQKPAGTVAALAFDGRLYARARAVKAGDLPPGVVGALGVEVLARGRLRFDPAAHALWLTP
ncbi:MAG: hypothetical protein QM608_08040 [Caulobacter sp.]